MPTDIRKIRPQCPGELEGICVKLLQKDPKFRYPTAAATAEVLEAWLAKYKAQRVLQVAKGGSESSLNLGDETDPSTGSKQGST